MSLSVRVEEPDTATRAIRCTVADPERQGGAIFEYRVVLDAGVPSAAVLTSIKLECAAGALTITAVRDWPLARWEAAARGSVTAGLTPAARNAEELLRAAFPEVDLAGDTPGERRHWTGLRKLAEAAELYRSLVAEGRPDPSAEMARIKSVSPATARSWIYRARQAGLLGPAVGRTAGEAS